MDIWGFLHRKCEEEKTEMEIISFSWALARHLIMYLLRAALSQSSFEWNKDNLLLTMSSKFGSQMHLGPSLTYELRERQPESRQLTIYSLVHFDTGLLCTIYLQQVCIRSIWAARVPPSFFDLYKMRRASGPESRQLTTSTTNIGATAIKGAADRFAPVAVWQ